MTLNEFREIDRLGRSHDPALFSLSSPDKRASADNIAAVEKSLQIVLPESYRYFLKEFGGGSYGLTTVFSCDPNSEWYLPSRQVLARGYLPGGLLAFSDDFAGGFYVLKVNNGVAEDRVLYWNQDGGLLETEHADVLEFVARYAYEPA